MSDINEVRARLMEQFDLCLGLPPALARPDDIRTLLDDHARLQAAHAEAMKAMRQAVIALAHAQESDHVYQNAYGVLDAAIDAAKAVQP